MVISIFNEKLVKHVFDDYLGNGEVDLNYDFLPCHQRIFDIFGPPLHSREPIGVKFRVAKRINVPLGPDKTDVNRCNESPLRGEKANFRPVNKFNTGSLPLCGILPVINQCACDSGTSP